MFYKPTVYKIAFVQQFSVSKKDANISPWDGEYLKNCRAV
jgi:hypothetical protein